MELISLYKGGSPSLFSIFELKHPKGDGYLEEAISWRFKFYEIFSASH